MKLRSKASIAVAAIVMSLLPTVARAQTPTPDQQVAAVSTINAVGQHVQTDAARVDLGNIVYLQGWAFECSSSSGGTVEIVLDGNVLQGQLIMRSARGDVWSWAVNSGVCPAAQTPYYSGAEAWIDISALAVGPHSVYYRVRNANGVVTDTMMPGMPLRPAVFVK